jgi:hypothetical protein
MGHSLSANDSQDIRLDQLHNSSRQSAESYERLLNDNDDVDDPFIDSGGDNQRLIPDYSLDTKALLKESRKKLLKSGAINIVWILTW